METYMEKFFMGYTIAVIVLTLLMLYRVFKGPGFFDRFIGVMVISTNAILILILVGFIDGRRDMYVDVAISYAVLGFFSAVIIAKFFGSSGTEEADGEEMHALATDEKGGEDDGY